jgi:hypothetical protein
MRGTALDSGRSFREPDRGRVAVVAAAVVVAVRRVLPSMSTLAAGCAAALVSCQGARPARPVATPEQVARMCAGVPEAERAHPSVLQPPELEDVRGATGERRLIKMTVQELRGADLLVRASPGLTKQWIARVVRCHVAYSDLSTAAGGEASPDPLLVDQAELSFDETETGFLIRIRGSSKAEGEEILARAQRLVGR